MRSIAEAVSMIRYKDNADFFKDIYKYRYAIVKGEALSVLAYGKEGCRKSNDIDLLVSRKESLNIENVLKRNGYCSLTSREERILLLSQSHQIAPYTKTEQRIEYNIDINFDIFWGEYDNQRIDIEDFLNDAIEISIYGVVVKTLPPIKAMIQLVLHHYKDMNSIFIIATRKSIKYDMFKDIYNLLMNNLSEITVEKLYHYGIQYNILPYIYYVFYYTGKLFKNPVLQKYIDAFRTPEGESLLNCYGLSEKERKEWKCDFDERLAHKDLYSLIQNDLDDFDRKKIEINTRVFLH